MDYIGELIVSAGTFVTRRQVTALHVGRFTDRALLLCNGDGDVVYRKSPLPEKIFAHVSQSGCRVDCVSSHAIPF